MDAEIQQVQEWLYWCMQHGQSNGKGKCTYYQARKNLETSSTDNLAIPIETIRQHVPNIAEGPTMNLLNLATNQKVLTVKLDGTKAFAFDGKRELQRADEKDWSVLQCDPDPTSEFNLNSVFCDHVFTSAGWPGSPTDVSVIEVMDLVFGKIRLNPFILVSLIRHFSCAMRSEQAAKLGVLVPMAATSIDWVKFNRISPAMFRNIPLCFYVKRNKSNRTYTLVKIYSGWNFKGQQLDPWTFAIDKISEMTASNSSTAFVFVIRPIKGTSGDNIRYSGSSRIGLIKVYAMKCEKRPNKTISVLKYTNSYFGSTKSSSGLKNLLKLNTHVEIYAVAEHKELQYAPGRPKGVDLKTCYQYFLKATDCEQQLNFRDVRGFAYRDAPPASVSNLSKELRPNALEHTREFGSPYTLLKQSVTLIAQLDALSIRKDGEKRKVVDEVGAILEFARLTTGVEHPMNLKDAEATQRIVDVQDVLPTCIQLLRIQLQLYGSSTEKSLTDVSSNALSTYDGQKIAHEFYDWYQDYLKPKQALLNHCNRPQLFDFSTATVALFTKLVEAQYNEEVKESQTVDDLAKALDEERKRIIQYDSIGQKIRSECQQIQRSFFIADDGSQKPASDLYLVQFESTMIRIIDKLLEDGALSDRMRDLYAGRKNYLKRQLGQDLIRNAHVVPSIYRANFYPHPKYWHLAEGLLLLVKKPSNVVRARSLQSLPNEAPTKHVFHAHLKDCVKMIRDENGVNTNPLYEGPSTDYLDSPEYHEVVAEGINAAWNTSHLLPSDLERVHFGKREDIRVAVGHFTEFQWKLGVLKCRKPLKCIVYAAAGFHKLPICEAEAQLLTQGLD